MLKGINKQIIEIRCTNDELFEKALLFVRADKADLPYDILAARSAEICRGFMPRTEESESRGLKGKRLKRALALLYTAAAGIVGVLIYFSFRL